MTDLGILVGVFEDGGDKGSCDTWWKCKQLELEGVLDL